MSLELQPLRPSCCCPELRTRCPACRAYAQTHKPNGAPLLGEPPDAVNSTAHLTAQHATIVAEIAAGVPYSTLALEYHVTVDRFMGYLVRTGAYVPRDQPRQQAMRALHPPILADRAAGMRLKDLAQKYGVSEYAVRGICRRAGVITIRQQRRPHDQ
jgi:Mor family transcriptional regulator